MEKSWHDYSVNLEEEARLQMEGAMSQPFAVKGALMPDAHSGYTLPIGGVVAAKDVVVPAWVGYDIGCGVFAAEIPFYKEEIEEHSEEIMQGIYNTVPVGFSSRDQDEDIPQEDCLEEYLTHTGREILESRAGRRSIGTLGGGNHFIELAYLENSPQAWMVIHSGSRGFGWEIGKHYMDLAKSGGSCGLEVDSQAGKDYLKDMEYACLFAKNNRKRIAEDIIRVMSRILRSSDSFTEDIAIRLSQDKAIDSQHNRAVLQDGLWVHRKGATPAHLGMLGVVPGNMQSGTFIVQGKGNPDSLNSCSHGAGRRMSRGKAKQTLSMEEFRESMAGITAKIEESTLDESPAAYKDIFEVMELQKELVQPICLLKPIVNIKA